MSADATKKELKDLRAVPVKYERHVVDATKKELKVRVMGKGG